MVRFERRAPACSIGWDMAWTGTRGTKAAPVEGEHLVFSFFTTDASAEVGAIHPKDMPAILTTQDEFDAWLSAPMEDALVLQRPLADTSLSIVDREQREDVPAEATWTK